MRYLGIARKEGERMVMADALREVKEGQTYEVVEIDGNLLLKPFPLKEERLTSVERLAQLSIHEHRQTLEGLAR